MAMKLDMREKAGLKVKVRGNKLMVGKDKVGEG